MKILKWIILVVISAILITFALMNRHMVTLHLFPVPFEIDISLFLLILLALLVGALLGGLSCLSYNLRCLRAARVANHRIALLEQEIAALKISSAKTALE